MIDPQALEAGTRKLTLIDIASAWSFVTHVEAMPRWTLVAARMYLARHAELHEAIDFSRLAVTLGLEPIPIRACFRMWEAHQAGVQYIDEILAQHRDLASTL